MQLYFCVASIRMIYGGLDVLPPYDMSLGAGTTAILILLPLALEGNLRTSTARKRRLGLLGLIHTLHHTEVEEEYILPKHRCHLKTDTHGRFVNSRGRQPPKQSVSYQVMIYMYVESTWYLSTCGVFHMHREFAVRLSLVWTDARTTPIIPCVQGVRPI